MTNRKPSSNDETNPPLFKNLTPENWRQHDPTSDHIMRTRDGKFEKISGDEWASWILKPQLVAAVPEDVKNLFEVARGVLCYGHFFYPLYVLGSEQLFRVQEAALRHKCVEMGAPKKVKTFDAMLSWLRDNGTLSEDSFGRWTAARQLRNAGSHATRQMLFGPPEAVSTAAIAAEMINDLFEEQEKAAGLP